MSTEGQDEEAPWPHPDQARLALFALITASILSYLDRSALSLLAEPVKASLKLTDTQLGLANGAAFGVFYAVAALPLGFIGDYWNRRNTIIIGVIVWSLATAACGLAQTANQLFVARALVGCGEAALGACALSMLCDFYPLSRRGVALGAYGTAVSGGNGASFIIGGILIFVIGETAQGTFEAWRLCFLFMGGLGVFVVALLLRVPEPVRRKSDAAGGVKLEGWIVKRLFFHAIAIASLTSFASAFVAWLPVLLGRQFGVASYVTGLTMGTIFLFVGGAATLAGGYLADHLRARNVRSPELLMLAFVFAGTGIFGFLFSTSDNLVFSLIVVMPLVACIAAPTGLSPGAIAEVTPPQLRGRVSVIFLLTMSVVGFSSGPVLVGHLSDGSQASIGTALGLLAVGSSALATVFVSLARRFGPSPCGPFIQVHSHV